MDKANRPRPSKAPSIQTTDKVSFRIKLIRLEKGISQTEVADTIGMERSNYNRMENRGEKLSFELIEKIAKALGVSLAELLNWGEENGSQPNPLTIHQAKESSLKLQALERTRDLMQDYIESLQRKLQLVTSEFQRSIDDTGEELKLGTVTTHEETDEYGLYYTTFTDQELYKIFDSWYAHNNKLYVLFRNYIQRDIIGPSGREATLFYKHSERKTKELIQKHGGLFT
ncbi:helix-turn-helix domain-containing protein [Spirosoma koreense]